jgi:chorismate mutase
MMTKPIEDIRKEFEAIDKQVLQLLAKRCEFSKAISSLKKVSGIDIIQPGIWQHQMQQRMKENELLGVDETFLQKIFSLIHAESVRIQNHEPTNNT